MTDSSLVARPLGQLTVINGASPAYLARHGTPRTLDDLDQHLLVHYVGTFGDKSSGWEYVDETGSKTRSMRGVVTVNDAGAYRSACLAGLGIIQAPGVVLRRLIDEGRLVEVLPEYRQAPMRVTLLYAHRRNLSKRVRVFMQWMAETLERYLDPVDGVSRAQ